jgi:hypothetical protein
MDHSTIHDLRRTFISHLAMAGVNASVVKELAGHASIATTQKWCTSISPQSMHSAQARLPFGRAIRSAPDISDAYHGSEKPQTEEAAKIINLDRVRAQVVRAVGIEPPTYGLQICSLTR